MRALIAAAFLSFAIVAPCAALHERPAALQTEFPSRLETRADIAADEWLVTVENSRVAQDSKKSVNDTDALLHADDSSRDGTEPARSPANHLAAETSPLEELCGAVVAAAKASELPPTFLANLIWQESRFNPRAVSPAGAEGIAQFMPTTAARSGLADPFDPLQAIPASAQLLRQLKQQFGNWGLAAAAYNAGPKRVQNWLAKGGLLPRETRGYVSIITGYSAEQWRGSQAQTDTLLSAQRLPCRSMAVFAELDEAARAARAVQPDRTEVVPAAVPPVVVRVRLAALFSKRQPSQSTAAPLANGRVALLARTKLPPLAKNKVIVLAETKVSLVAKAKLPLVTKVKLAQLAHPKMSPVVKNGLVREARAGRGGSGPVKGTQVRLAAREPVKSSTRRERSSSTGRGSSQKMKIT